MPPVSPPRFAIYLRKSVDGGERDQSIETQRQVCRGLLPTGADHDEYIDIESGGNVGREQYQRILRRLDDYEGVAVWELSRLGRRASEMLRLLDELETKGKQLLQAHGVCARTRAEYDQVRMPLAMQAVMDEEERRRTGRRMRSVNERLVRGGQFIAARPPFGYGYDRERKALTVDPEEAETVREIFRLYVEERLPARAIAVRLTEEGHRTRWQRPWRATGILWALRNPVYVGMVAYGRTQRDGNRVRRVQNSLVREAGIVAQGTHEPLISRETWDLAAAIDLERQPDRRICSAVPRPLTPVVQCGHCGSPMAAGGGGHRSDTESSYPYYVCTRTLQGGVTACPGARANADWLEPAVLGVLAANCERARELMPRIRKVAGSRTLPPPAADRERAIRRKMDDEEWMLRHGVIDREKFLRNWKGYERQLKGLEKERRHPTVKPPGELHDLYDRANPHQRRAIIAQLIDHIIVHPDRIEVRFAPLAVKGWRKRVTFPKARYQRPTADSA